MDWMLVLAAAIGFCVTTALYLACDRIGNLRIRGPIQGVAGCIGFASLILLYNGYDPYVSPWEQVWSPVVENPTSLGGEVESIDFDSELLIVQVTPERSAMIQRNCESSGMYLPLHMSLIEHVKGAGESGVIGRRSWERVRLEIRASDGRCLMSFPALDSSSTTTELCAC